MEGDNGWTVVSKNRWMLNLTLRLYSHSQQPYMVKQMKSIQPTEQKLESMELLPTYGCSRRGFLKAACAPMLIATLGTTLASCDSQGPEDEGDGSRAGILVDGDTVTLDLAKSGPSALAAAGGFLYIAEAQMIAVNVDGTVRAFTSVCPHRGDPVSSLTGGVFVCSSGHGGTFDTSGRVVTGPPKAPLAEYTATRTGSTVTIKKA